MTSVWSRLTHPWEHVHEIIHCGLRFPNPNKLKKKTQLLIETAQIPAKIGMDFTTERV